MHVALAMWMALALSQSKVRMAAWCYFVVISFGSVYFGWHYAVDTIGGVAVSAGAWMIARRFAHA
jgi:membrane-associated phospholipid phosphatase